MSEPKETVAVPDTETATAAHEPHIKVLKGEPTAEDLAALIGVLSAAGGGPGEPAVTEANLWGHPVDRLRYQSHSWQRVTLLERTHLRR
ncbi:acyl-CoA carboxylase subunit epsilon [Mycolicibacterium diernhoferi]|uniref:acyl-CoA carboxylase subunit epsilon n=1 Tax=Mycolicibacterium diernhoferi TaxID=1801 RepID=UPI0009A1CE14|nr:acyl-CoA carboxylase subunit epsilon [Mycolicibacterium diernhoferi]QYL24165.1 acyl-CoA carboxylase subunit epsilon [Mycolicibacterium diernhoferi]